MSRAQQQTVFRVKEKNILSGIVKCQEPIPIPQPHEVLVRIHAVSLNFRDYLPFSGKYPLPVKQDVVPGSDMAGEVLSVGSAVLGFKQGDRVTANFDQNHWYGALPDERVILAGSIDGVLQEYRIFPEMGLLHIPKHLSYEEASCWPCAGVTAWNALFGGVPLMPGQTVLFQGTGGVSIAGLILAHAAGAKTIVTSSSDDKLEIAKKLGATHVVNYKRESDWDQVVLKITEGVGAHLILDNVGAQEIERCYNCVARGGTIASIGFLGNNPEKVPDVAMLNLLKCVTLRGVYVGSKQLHEDLLRFVGANELRPHIDKVFPFEQTPEAIDYLSRGQHTGKIVIRVVPQ